LPEATADGIGVLTATSQSPTDNQPAHWLAGFWVPLIVAFGLFAALQFPDVKQSFIGTPDRAMVDFAFKMRRGQVGGTADPVLWLDMDQASLEDHFREQQGRGAFDVVPPDQRGLPNGAPRDIIASLLTYSRSGSSVNFARGASLVVLDTFLAWDSGNEAAERELMAALEAWAGDTNAPMLGLVQAHISPADSVGPYVHVLPSRYDAIVARAPNIVWVHPSVTKDDANIVREYHPYLCVIQNKPDGTQGPVGSPSVAAFAAFVQKIDRANPADSQTQRNQKVREALAQGQEEFNPSCNGHSRLASHSVPIKYHIGYSIADKAAAARQLDQAWKHSAKCGVPPALTRLPSAGFTDPSQSPDIAPLCGHMVIIGANNDLLPDVARTPIGQALPGPVVLANTMRSALFDLDTARQLKDWQRIALQSLLLLILVSIQVPIAKWLETRHLYYESITPAAKFPASFARFVKWVLTHPLVMKFWLPVVGSFIGLAFTLWGLDYGFYAIVSAPVYAVALVAAWRQFNTLAMQVLKR
jgi:CHASE2 domain